MIYVVWDSTSRYHHRYSQAVVEEGIKVPFIPVRYGGFAIAAGAQFWALHVTRRFFWQLN